MSPIEINKTRVKERSQTSCLTLVLANGHVSVPELALFSEALYLSCEDIVLWFLWLHEYPEELRRTLSKYERWQEK